MLGSGVEALFAGKKVEQELAENPEKVVKELSKHFAMIPLAEIERNPDQPRYDFNEEALAELAQSIKTHGIIQPLTVRYIEPHRYQIVSGERRWRASKIAELVEVPAYIRVADDQELLEMAIIENIQREDLNAMEIANSMGSMPGTTICGLADGNAWAARTIMQKFKGEFEARDLGHDLAVVEFDANTAAGYWPESRRMHMRVIADRGTRRLLGAQIFGGRGAAKRIDAMAMAIWNDMTADDLVNADLSYAPPFSGVWDPVLHAARLMQSELDR